MTSQIDARRRWFGVVNSESRGLPKVSRPFLEVEVSLSQDLDAVLDGVVESDPRVPGVVAMVTDRNENVYEGSRELVTLGPVSR